MLNGSKHAELIKRLVNFLTTWTITYSEIPITTPTLSSAPTIGTNSQEYITISLTSSGAVSAYCVVVKSSES